MRMPEEPQLQIYCRIPVAGRHSKIFWRAFRPSAILAAALTPSNLLPQFFQLFPRLHLFRMHLQQLLERSPRLRFVSLNRIHPRQI
jgi:hypothetical protein